MRRNWTSVVTVIAGLVGGGVVSAIAGGATGRSERFSKIEIVDARGGVRIQIDEDGLAVKDKDGRVRARLGYKEDGDVNEKYTGLTLYDETERRCGAFLVSHVFEKQQEAKLELKVEKQGWVELLAGELKFSKYRTQDGKYPVRTTLNDSFLRLYDEHFHMLAEYPPPK
jgi:hypothetical protein